MIKAITAAVLAAAVLLPLTGCAGPKEEQMSISDEITRSVITHEYDTVMVPAGDRTGYRTPEEYLNASFEGMQVTAGSKESLSLLTALARQDASSADSGSCADEAAAYLQEHYPAYLETRRSTEAALYSAYLLVYANENDKSSSRYTLGTVTAHAIQEYYVGEETKEAAQSHIDHMGTQFFDSSDTGPQTEGGSRDDS